MQLILKNLHKNYRNEFYLLVLMMFMSAILETLSIGLFIPVITLLTNNDIFETYPKLEFLINFIGEPTKQNQILAFLGIFLFVFIFKNIFLLIYIWRESKFVSKIKEYSSIKLYENYLQKDYYFHVKNNSSKIISRITADLNIYAASVHGFIQFVAEFLVIIFIGSFLIYFEPIGFLFSTVFLIFLSSMLYLLTNRSIKFIGQERVKEEANKIKKLQEAFTGIKDIKTFKIQKKFLNLYNILSKKLLNIYTLFRFYQRIPRIYFEVISVITIVLFILLLIYFDYNLSHIVTIIGVFTFAAFRLLPSVNKIFSTLQLIKFAKKPINLISQDLLKKIALSNTSNHKPFYTLKLKNLSFKYENKIVIKNLNFELKRGEKVAIIGETGSGKTTLLDIILGLLDIRKGKIYLNGKNINSLKNNYLNISYVPQKVFLFDDTIKNNVLFQSKKTFDKVHYEKCIRVTQLKKFINKLSLKDKTIIGENGAEISGGQAQRIGIARALYSSNEIILLDEPTSALDSKTEKIIMNNIFKKFKNKTIILITHAKENLKFFNKVYEFKNNTIKRYKKNK
jgi:ATP-binding cassette, subfamily B, bacterial PglK